MELVVGTYEQFLVGYSLKKKKNQLVLEQSFTNHAHHGSVRSIATSGKYLASGSIDEIIHLINMRHRVDSGTLTAHLGTVTALQFLRSAYLFSASEDGNICIWNSKKQWLCEKILRGHREGVTSLSIHSSGKLLLSVSKDKTLRTWNLIKGRCAYILNLKEVANLVLWSPSCVYFAAVFDYRVDIYDLSTGGVFASIEKEVFQNRINKILFIDDTTIILFGDCNDIIIYNFNTKTIVNKFTAHENRIKDGYLINASNIDSTLVDSETIDDNIRWLVTTSSDGFIKIWSIDLSNLEEKPCLITQVNTTCRPTCLAVWISNLKSNEKTENFSIPELKISKEELEVCKEKLREKRNKRRQVEETIKVTNEAQEETDEKEIQIEKPKPKKNKKARLAEKSEEEELVAKKPNNYEDDDDDEEAIKNMKASSKILKQVAKFKKGKGKNNKRGGTFNARKDKPTGHGRPFRTANNKNSNNRSNNQSRKRN